MKNLRLLAIGSAILMVALLPAVAQTGRTMLVRVPFGFTVNDRQLPPGKYTVEIFSSGVGMALHGPRGVGVLVPAFSPISSASTRSFERRLVFHRFGEEYFLAEVWTSERGQKVLPGERHRQMLTTVRAEQISITALRPR